MRCVAAASAMAPVWCDYGEATAVVPRPVLALAPVLAPVPVQDRGGAAVADGSLVPVLVLVLVLVVLLLSLLRPWRGRRSTGYLPR